MAQAATQANQGYEHHIAALTTAESSNTPYFQTGSGKQGSLRKMVNGSEKIIWTRSLSNELGRLLPNGVGKNRPKAERIKGTGTIFPIRKAQVPKDRKVTYANFQCTIRPQKAETHRVRCTAGGDKLDYPFDASSPAVSMLDAKLHINSTISDAKRGARYLGLDIKNFYLGTPMEYYQYFRIHKQDIPQEILDEYPDIVFEADGYAYFEIRRGMYGLKEAGVIAFHQLKKRLAPHGYAPVPFTTGLWKHKTLPTTFILCVDDFGVKYFSKKDAQHLIDAVLETYEASIDWSSGSQFCGLSIDWNYTAHPRPYADISMPNFTKKALTKYNHPTPKLPQFAPHKWVAPVYGSKTPQKPVEKSKSAPLDKKDTLRVQGISGTFRFYAQGVDPTILPALHEIASQQSKPTQDTLERTNMLMDYLHTYPEAVIRFYASDIQLYIDTDAAYLVLPGAKSRAAGHYYLSNKVNSIDENPPPNGPFHVLCKTIPNVVASAAEAETGGTFMNGKEAAPIRVTLEEMGHPQGSTRITTDNLTAKGILTREMRQKLSKAYDMRFYWIRDRIQQQKQYHLKWEKGTSNKADYFTKHHPPWHHKKMQHVYLQKLNLVTQKIQKSNDWLSARGCVTSSTVNGRQDHAESHMYKQPFDARLSDESPKDIIARCKDMIPNLIS